MLSGLLATHLTLAPSATPAEVNVWMVRALIGVAARKTLLIDTDAASDADIDANGARRERVRRGPGAPSWSVDAELPLEQAAKSCVARPFE